MRARWLTATLALGCVVPYAASDPRPLPTLAGERPRSLDARREEDALRRWVLVRTPRDAEITEALRAEFAVLGCAPIWPALDVVRLNCDVSSLIFPSGESRWPALPTAFNRLIGVLMRRQTFVADFLVAGGADQQRCCERFPQNTALPPRVPSDCAACRSPGADPIACNRCLSWSRAEHLRNEIATGLGSALNGEAVGVDTCWIDRRCPPYECDHARRLQIVIRFDTSGAPPCSRAMTDAASTLFCYQEVFRREGETVAGPMASASVIAHHRVDGGACPLISLDGAASSLFQFISR